MKLLQENIGRTLFKSQQHFLDLAPKGKEIKAKINKRNLLKLKSFNTVKEIIDQMKIPTEREKTFVNDMTNKGSISNIYK